MNKRKLRQQHFEEMQARARSVTVGTAFGGTTELIMRRGDSSFTFAIMQPVEVVELIYQLAANVGCDIQLAPRRDFASWRQWNAAPDMAEDGGASFSHANDFIAHQQRGATLPPPERQPGMAATEGPEHGEAMAIEAPKQRRKSKRAAGTS